MAGEKVPPVADRHAMVHRVRHNVWLPAAWQPSQNGKVARCALRSRCQPAVLEDQSAMLRPHHGHDVAVLERARQLDEREERHRCAGSV